MIVHRSNRIETLVDALVDVVAVPVADPFAPEWIAVQGRGMERWLGMELARRLGVWANPAFPFPRRVIEAALEAVLGPAGGATAVFEPQRLRWAVAEALAAQLGRPAYAPLRRYLADDARGTKRLQLSGRIADLFDQYAVYRPHLVVDWERGADGGWQAELWRALVSAHGAGHAAARARALLEALAAGRASTDALPRRLSLFGISTLPPLYAEMLAALGARVELHLFVLCPSREYWGDLRSRREVMRASRLGRHTTPSAPAATARRPPEEVVGHPLLASLGRVGRDFQDVLEGVAEYESDDRYVEPGTGSMLAVLQSDMLALRVRIPGREDEPLPLRAGDDSIAVHACHGPMREIEVLHDQLLALFDADPTLTPADVVVMAPAIDAYAPLVEAVFGSGGRPPIPFRIADRRARAQHEVVDAFLRALELLGGRLPAPDVLDLLALEPVRARFGIAAEELERLHRWVGEAGVRWAADAAHRGEAGQPACAENTWRFGLDRLLLGYALPGDGTRLFHGVLPYDDVEGSDAALLGRFAALCATLARCRDAVRAPRHPATWRETLGEMLAALVERRTATAYQHQALAAALDALAEHATAGGFTGSVDLDGMRRLLEDAVGAAGSPRGFLTGAVTFCEMVPMRTIPFRVVCLVGLNDGSFPRARRPLGFDLMAARPQVGDRTARDDDRYLFLEALLAARQRLIVSYVGQSIADNTELPPSVVVNELLDALDAAFAAPGGGRARDRIVQRHALQAFSPRYFENAPPQPAHAAGGPPAVPGGQLSLPGLGYAAPPIAGVSALFSYSAMHCAGARALLGPRRGAPAWFTAALAEEPLETLALDELVRFFDNPTRWFLQRRLGIFVGRDGGLLDAREPIELDQLEQWRIGDALLRRAVDGADPAEAWELFRAAGALPLGAPGQCAYETIAARVAALTAAAGAARGGARLPAEELALAVDGVRITGVLRDLWPAGQIAVQYARLGERYELGVWIRHLARNAAGAAAPSALIGRAAKGDAPAAVRFAPPREPGRHLAGLLRLFRLGQQAPLPFFRFASRAFASALAARDASADAALAAARAKFRADDHGGGDLDDPYVAELYADRSPFEDAAAAPCEISFAAAARAVFEPLLQHREKSR
jgi:exodeoxyribonuclease V gamma subunit